MENNIAEAVIKALVKSPNTITMMEIEQMDETLTQLTAYDTVTTMKTLEEKFD
jgi:hypothetical protein